MSAATRRGAIRLSAAALVASVAATTRTKANAAGDDQDAELIRLCDDLVSCETEMSLLSHHDEYAPDYGPNNERYEYLLDRDSQLTDEIREHDAPTTLAGSAAVCRVGLICLPYDHKGNPSCTSFSQEVLVMLGRGLNPGFVWPPKPGSCSTAHWAPPTSPEEVAAQQAAWDAKEAERKAQLQAERDAKEAECLSSLQPANWTDNKLQGRVAAGRQMVETAKKLLAEYEAEAARRGIVA